MVIINVLARQMNKAILDVDVKSAKSATKVNNLHQWILLPKEIVLNAIGNLNNPISTYFCNSYLYISRKPVKKDAFSCA